MPPVATAGPKQLKLRMRTHGRPSERVPLLSGLRRTRDPLPENMRYRDDGCSVSDSCFTCPLPRCRYEEPGGLRGVLNEMRDRQILALKQDGVPVEELAGRFQVSRRTVFRVLEGTSPRSRRRRPAPDNLPIPIFLRREPDHKEANCA